MDTEHTPVKTPIKTPVQVPHISQRPTPIKAPPVIAAPAVVTTRSGRVIRPAKNFHYRISALSCAIEML